MRQWKEEGVQTAGQHIHTHTLTHTYTQTFIPNTHAAFYSSALTSMQESATGNSQQGFFLNIPLILHCIYCVLLLE